MSALFQSRPVYSGLRSSKGLATMRDVWSFARFCGEQLGQNVIVDGVEFAKAGHLKTEVPLAQTARTAAGFRTDVPALRFDRSRGLALRADLEKLAAWLQPQLEMKWRNSSAKFTLGRPAVLPLPEGTLIRRAELLAFIRAVGEALGFRAESSDLTGIRDTGHGIHVSRRARVASIIVRSQSRHGHGKACFAFTAEDGDTGYITVRTITYTHEVGSIVETYTASGAVQGVGPGGVFDDCAEVEFESSGSASGALLSVEISDNLVPWDSVIAAAAGAVADDGSPAEEWTAEWTEDEWRAESGARNEFITLSESARGNIYGEGVAEGWNIQAPKIQIENTGDTQLEVEITFTRVSDSATETLDPVIVQPHATSDWIDTRAADPTEIWNCHITRVGIGGF